MKSPIWLFEPAAAVDDAVWQGRQIWRIAVIAESPAYARLEADKWAASTGLDGVRRPGFEDQLLYHVHPGPPDLTLESFGDSRVLVVGEPVASAGAQNERPTTPGWPRVSPEGKTTTTQQPDGRINDLPGRNR